MDARLVDEDAKRGDRLVEAVSLDDRRERLGWAGVGRRLLIAAVTIGLCVICFLDFRPVSVGGFGLRVRGVNLSIGLDVDVGLFIWVGVGTVG
ncbi:hypothetical protein [Halorarius halobius]|uniref:hypothetical protein n=1 Tax=Halorarius halobius TaxID=2962671 RepID=UPI0020CCCBFB|nr:hypothetical protein [Halorarius halobius]